MLVRTWKAQPVEGFRASNSIVVSFTPWPEPPPKPVLFCWVVVELWPPARAPEEAHCGVRNSPLMEKFITHLVEGVRPSNLEEP